MALFQGLLLYVVSYGAFLHIRRIMESIMCYGAINVTHHLIMQIPPPLATSHINNDPQPICLLPAIIPSTSSLLPT